MRGETLKLKKDKRREAIRQQIDSNPFITDHELSDLFQVSIQTIRLDRTYLNIPELRERIKLVAEKNYDQISSIEEQEFIGDLIQVNPNVKAQSILDITSDSVFHKTGIARGHVLFAQGHVLFAQANSLCVALIKQPTVLTHESSIQFIEKVKLNDTVRAEARVVNQTAKHFYVEVKSYVKHTLVFKGNFKMFYDKRG